MEKLVACERERESYELGEGPKEFFERMSRGSHLDIFRIWEITCQKLPSKNVYF